MAPGAKTTRHPPAESAAKRLERKLAELEEDLDALTARVADLEGDQPG